MGERPQLALGPRVGRHQPGCRPVSVVATVTNRLRRRMQHGARPTNFSNRRQEGCRQHRI